MKLASLQFAPQLGRVDENIARADTILAASDTYALDTLVLPELAFSGYNFPDFAAIKPFLEPTARGRSTLWAQRTAARLQCTVTVGYPEISEEPYQAPPADGDEGTETPLSEALLTRAIPVARSMPNESGFKCYNSTVTVAPTGEVLYHYRKHFLFYTDATWAEEGAEFGAGVLSLKTDDSRTASQAVKFAHGICMDINPYQFTAPYSAFEFANHVLQKDAELVMLSNAWLNSTTSSLDAAIEADTDPSEPDLATITHWVERLAPVLLSSKRQVTVICANRCGIEGPVTYAGSSCIMKIGQGQAGVWKCLGKHEEGLLRVDTDLDAFEMRFKSRLHDTSDE